MIFEHRFSLTLNSPDVEMLRVMSRFAARAGSFRGQEAITSGPLAAQVAGKLPSYSRCWAADTLALTEAHSHAPSARVWGTLPNTITNAPAS